MTGPHAHRTTPERVAALESMVTDIHRAVVGDGSKGSSLRERISSLETIVGGDTDEPLGERVSAVEADVRNLKDWRTQAFKGGVQTMTAAAVAYLVQHLGLQLPPGGHT